MSIKWSDAIGPHRAWHLQDVILEQLEKILEIRTTIANEIYEKMTPELDTLNDALTKLYEPTLAAKGKASIDPNPLGETWRTTFLGKFVLQFRTLIEQEFASARSQVTSLKHELDVFKKSAQAIKNSRPSTTSEVEEVEKSYALALRRCESARELYDEKCEELQGKTVKSKGRLSSLKHQRNGSTASLLSLDDPVVNSADHDYRKAIIIANNLQVRRNLIFRSGYMDVPSSNTMTIRLARTALLSHLNISMQVAKGNLLRFQSAYQMLKEYNSDNDIASVSYFASHEQGLEPSPTLRHDNITGFMSRVVFCVPISYVSRSINGSPWIISQSFNLCDRLLEQSQWDEQAVAHFATTPKLSSGRFEEIIIEIERHTHDISATVQNIPEAIGLMNYFFFSLPRPLLRLNTELVTDAIQCKTWWQSPSDTRKAIDLFRPGAMDKFSERTLKFVLEELARILPHAKNIHIADAANTWSRPLFQSTRPSNSEVTVLSVLLCQALRYHPEDPRWLALWVSPPRSRVSTP